MFSDLRPPQRLHPKPNFPKPNSTATFWLFSDIPTLLLTRIHSKRAINLVIQQDKRVALKLLQNKGLKQQQTPQKFTS